MSLPSVAECPDCTVLPLTRNHYFTGKLLVERDFTDEQRYYMEKLRLHHQRLHGAGVVCGLAVRAHESPNCQTRMVWIEPGSAIDCCGHDILVVEPELVDLTTLPGYMAKIGPGDTGEHILQICLRYRECPTEEIPVLFDDCGCDDTQCAPNRILESYEIDVIVDPDPVAAGLTSPKVSWDGLMSPAHAKRVALHAPTRRLYALAEGSNVVFQVDVETELVTGAHALPAPGLDLAVSGDGAHLFVAAVNASGNGADERQLHVLETANALGNAPVSTSDLTNSGGSDIFLALAPDGRLLALLATPGDLLVWDATVATASPVPAPTTVSLGAGLRGLALAGTGPHGYSTDAANLTLPAADLAASPPGAVAAIPLPAGTAAPTQLARASSTAGDLLAVIGGPGPEIYLVDPAGPTLVGRVALDHEPVDVVVSAGGQWAYVLERAGTQSYVQAVNLFQIQRALPPLKGTPVEVGRDSRQLVLGPGGQLYVPFVDDPALPDGGGVAVLTVSEADCGEILWRHLDGCPTCAASDCLVLATVAHYHRDDRLLDQTQPPADPLADGVAKIARIDNHAGRQLLPDVQTVVEWVKCLMAQGGGGAGPQGPPGAPGAPGQDGASVQSATAASGTPVSATFDPLTGNIHFVIPPGTPGAPGAPGEQGDPGPPGEGLEQGLIQIGALSWIHRQPTPLDTALVAIQRLRDGPDRGLVIGFTGLVLVGDPDSPGKFPDEIDADHIFQVLIEHEDDRLARELLVCRCPVRGQIIPVEYTDDGAGLITGATEVAGPGAPGAAFLFDPEWLDRFVDGLERPRELWIKLRGDFVVEALVQPNGGIRPGRAIDAEFVRGRLPTGDRPAGSKFGIQGGLFESWFPLVRG